MKTLVVLKQNIKTGNRAIGSKFQAPDQAAKVWIELGLVYDVNAPKPKAKTKKKSK